MTAFTSILNGQIVQDKPATTSLVAALRDNPVAIAEGDPSAPRVKPVLFHVQYRVASGGNGGTFTSGSWRIRPINTVILNNISGASLATNQITLPAGTYDASIFAMASAVQFHKLRFYNVTDGGEQNNLSSSPLPMIGMTAYSVATLDNLSIAALRDRFTIASTKAFEIQHRSSNTQATTGMGIPNSFSVDEIYLDAMFEKIG